MVKRGNKCNWWNINSENQMYNMVLEIYKIAVNLIYN